MPATFNFTGEVVNVIPGTGLFSVVPGDTVTGSYTFDTAVFALGSPYKLDVNPVIGPSASVFDITINAGGVTRSTSDNAPAVLFGSTVPPLHALYFEDGGGFTGNIDRFRMQGKTYNIGDDSAFLALSDNSPKPDPDGIAPGSGNLTPEVMLRAPDVSLFTSTDSNFYTARDEFGTLEGDIQFRLTSIVAAAAGGDPGSAFLPTGGSGGSGDPFDFRSAPGGGFWFDPPAASGFEYRTTDGSKFTQVQLPALSSVADGDGLYLVSSSNGDQTVSAGDLLSFAVPVDFFTVTGIDPSVDGGDPLAFPTFLAFDQDQVDFTMTPIEAASTENPPSAPEPGTLGLVVLTLIPVMVRTASRRER